MSAVARVADLAEQLRGVSYGKEDASSTPRPGFLPILRAGNITDDGLVFDDLVFVPADRIADKQKIRRNDVVIAASSGSLDVVGKAARALDDYNGGFGAFCKVLRPGPNVDPSYFAHFFRTAEYRRRISALAAGININNLRNAHLDEMLVPLPPLAEQRRIAEILDKADALQAKRRVALARLDHLAQSIFRNAFGNDGKGNGRWSSVPLESIVRDTKLGLVRGSTEFGPDLPVPYVRMNAITRTGELDLTDVQRTVATDEEIEAYRLMPGDLLFNTRNSKELVGKTALCRAHGLHLFNNNIMRIRFNADAEPEFVAAVFRTPFIQHELELRKSGTTNVFAIYYKDLRTLPVPLPPIHLQRQFCRGVAAVEMNKAAQRKSSGQLNALFASLQARCFRAELYR
jgi:type I restriction enzyme S subunit